jgi:hypothetical protein
VDAFGHTSTAMRVRDLPEYAEKVSRGIKSPNFLNLMHLCEAPTSCVSFFDDIVHYISPLVDK